MNDCMRGAVLFMGFLLSAGGQLAAQTTGVLRGQVLDPSGASIPNATVSVTAPNNPARNATSDSAGNFSIQGLPPGAYAVRVSAAGFGTFERTLELAGGRVTALEIRLALAQERQEVTVADQARVELDPAGNASAVVLKGEDFSMLTENPDDLENELQALAGPSVGPNGGQILLDGFGTDELPPKESIREVRINSNPFSAEFEKVGFGRIEIFTSPGTDRLRGMALFNFADSAFNSRNPYSPEKPPSQLRQYNFNLTGPLTKKASFNFDATHGKQDSTALVNAQVLNASLQPVGRIENIEAPNTRTNVVPRFDYALTPNMTLQFRYSYFHPTLDNIGVGQFTLPERATSSVSTHQSGQITLTDVVGTRYVNETRFQYHHSGTTLRGGSTGPSINVLSSFNGGGANLLVNDDDEGSYDFQNLNSYTRGRHFLRFGVRVRAVVRDNASTSNFNGTYTFTTLDAYAITLKGAAQGLPFDQIRALGGGARQYSVTGGTPLASVNQVDAGPFFQDDWRVIPNVTLSLGLRYETQTNVSGTGDWAPRASLAWGIGGGTGRQRQPKTVLRLGFGMFYDRISDMLKLQTVRQNGINQQNFVIAAPNFFPVAPPVAQLTAALLPQAIYRMDATLQAPRILQSAVTLERQLPKNITLSVGYTNSRGVHQLRSRNINAPLPVNAGFPYGNSGQLFLYESSALFKQSQLTVNVNARVNAKVSLFGYYAHGTASSNSDGAASFPANTYDLTGEWGRAGFDIRDRAQIGGTLVSPMALELAPNIAFSSAPPLNIVTGTDLNGDSIFNDRPAFATAPADPSRGVVPTRWGVFNLDPLHNPSAGAIVIPRNYATAYGRVDVGFRLSRTWNFGEPPARGRNGAKGRYSLNAGVQVRNVLNHVNPGTPVGNLSSPFFGQALNLPGGQSANANRRLELNLRLSF